MATFYIESGTGRQVTDQSQFVTGHTYVQSGTGQIFQGPAAGSSSTSTQPATNQQQVGSPTPVRLPTGDTVYSVPEGYDFSKVGNNAYVSIGGQSYMYNDGYLIPGTPYGQQPGAGEKVPILQGYVGSSANTPPPNTPPPNTSTDTTTSISQALIGSAITGATSLANSGTTGITLAQAWQAAKTDPTILQKYADAAAIDKEAFSQNISQIQAATALTSQQNQQAFENERKALADQYAAAGAAYSGYRGQAQSQLAQSEQNVVTSSISQTQKALNDATAAFEAKYGSAATKAATTQLTNPYTSSQYSISGLYNPTPASVSSLTGAMVGGVTGTQAPAQAADTLSLATQYVNAGSTVPMTPIK